MRRVLVSTKVILSVGLRRPNCSANLGTCLAQHRHSHNNVSVAVPITASTVPSQSTSSSPPLTGLDRLRKEVEDAKPRPDPSGMDSILDVVSAIVDVRADYEGEINKALQRYSLKTKGGGQQSPNGPNNRMASHKRLIKAVDQRYLAMCVERANELFEMAVAYPEKNLLADDMASADLLTATLMALDEAVRFVDRPANFPYRYNQAANAAGRRKSAFSPWLSTAACEFIGTWMALRWDAKGIASLPYDEIQRRLVLCCELFVGDVDSVAAMSHRLCSKEALAKQPNPTASAVTSLNAVTLAVKRLNVKAGDLSGLLAVISFSKTLTSQQSLQVLSSLCRVYESRDLDLVSAITRRETARVGDYSLADALFALKACMSLSNVAHPFVAEVIRALAPFAQQMQPRELASVCHLLTMMRNSRRHAHVIRSTCARDVKRLMPALLAQTKVHLKKFSPKDANYVLDCFLAFHVQHPYTFAQLTAGVGE